MAKVLRVLIVDDNEDDALLMVRRIKQDGYEVIYVRVETADTMKEALERVGWDVVLADYAMPYFSGPDALALVREIDPDLSCIIVSGTMGEDTAVAMMRAGANDYLMKDNLIRLTPAIEREIGDAAVRRQRTQIEEDRKRLMLGIEQATEIIVITDTDGTIQYANPAFEHITGYTREEAIGQNPRILKSGKHDDAFYKEMWDTLLRGETWSGEIINKKKDGTLYVEEATISPVRTAAGKTTNYVGVKHDITDRKQAQKDILVKSEQLRASNQQLRTNELEREKLLKTLTAKNKELQSIVYVSSHDLKSPLVNITGFSGELTRSCDRIKQLVNLESVSEELKGQLGTIINNDIPESLKFITSSVIKMKTLLNGLLEVSHVGIVSIKIELLDMNEIVKSVLSSMQFHIEEQKVSVTVEQLPDCFGDASQVNNMMSNLIGNAVNYLAPSRKGAINIRGWVEGNVSVYCVEDNGIGIVNDHQLKVFEIFHRLNPNDSVGGEGLGLTIISRILDRHNGKIWVESEPGKGSKFFVSLPMVKA